MTVFNLEYRLTDKIGRAQKATHVGVFSSLVELEEAKNLLVKQHGDDKVRFEIFPINNLFEKIAQV